MVERLIEEIRRRERVVRIFPTMDAFFAWERAQAEHAEAEHAEAEPDPTATPLPHAA
jgi:transposase-like protein